MVLLKSTLYSPSNGLYVDSCLTGMGAFYQGKENDIPIHSSPSLMSNVHLEAANVLVALRCWAQSLRNSHCLIWCDNWAWLMLSPLIKLTTLFFQIVLDTCG